LLLLVVRLAAALQPHWVQAQQHVRGNIRGTWLLLLHLLLLA
jgi:hypothetical protein